MAVKPSPLACIITKKHQPVTVVLSSDHDNRATEAAHLRDLCSPVNIHFALICINTEVQDGAGLRAE